MINENEYDQKFSSLIKALQEARVLYENSSPQDREQVFAQWQNLKEEFNQLATSHRQSAPGQKPHP